MKIDHKEAYKYFFEGLKHLTTLNSGIILILVSLVTKKEISKNLIYLNSSLICICISLLFCLWGMFSIGTIFEKDEGYNQIQWSIGIAFSTFLLAISGLAFTFIVS